MDAGFVGWGMDEDEFQCPLYIYTHYFIDG